MLSSAPLFLVGLRMRRVSSKHLLLIHIISNKEFLRGEREYQLSLFAHGLVCSKSLKPDSSLPGIQMLYVRRKRSLNLLTPNDTPRRGCRCTDAPCMISRYPEPLRHPYKRWVHFAEEDQASHSEIRVYSEQFLLISECYKHPLPNALRVLPVLFRMTGGNPTLMMPVQGAGAFDSLFPLLY